MTRKPGQIVTTDSDADRDVVAVIRRLALAQYRVALANVPRTMAGESDEPLHELRGAIRRLRVLLKLLRKLPDMEAVDATDDAKPRRFVKTLKTERQRALARTRAAIQKLQAASACRALLAELRDRR